MLWLLLTGVMMPGIADVDNDRMLLKGGCVIQLCFECMCLQGPASLQGPHMGPVAVLLVPSNGAFELLM